MSVRNVADCAAPLGRRSAHAGASEGLLDVPSAAPHEQFVASVGKLCGHAVVLLVQFGVRAENSTLPFTAQSRRLDAPFHTRKLGQSRSAARVPTKF